MSRRASPHGGFLFHAITPLIKRWLGLEPGEYGHCAIYEIDQQTQPKLGVIRTLPRDLMMREATKFLVDQGNQRSEGSIVSLTLSQQEIGARSAARRTAHP